MEIRRHADPESMHELCSIAVLGEISPEDMHTLSAHLEICRECRKLIKELDDLARLDLSSAAAARIVGQAQCEIDPTHEAELLSRLMNRVEQETRLDQPERLDVHGLPETIVPACPLPMSYRIRVMLRQVYPIAGWALSGALAVALILINSRTQSAVITSPAETASSNDSALRAEAAVWKDRALSAEMQSAAQRSDLEARKLQAQNLVQALAAASAKYRDTLIEKQQLETRISMQEAELHQQAFALNTAQARLDEERSDAASLRAQLQQVSAHLDQQRSEIAKLQQVAAVVPARLPAKMGDDNAYDGREVFGARDLHIVDVYDVDQSGKSSRTYGRVYYVNQSLLLFYAFDLDHNAKLRKPVAFQAWGFRQPNSKVAESLGLFYLEDPKLDRWTLRVSDPRLLARIDSLFVTVEPPGGSNAPRGRRLLFASLAGPPNHP